MPEWVPSPAVLIAFVAVIGLLLTGEWASSRYLASVVPGTDRRNPRHRDATARSADAVSERPRPIGRMLLRRRVRFMARVPAVPAYSGRAAAAPMLRRL
jgi:hypothetical protein